MLLAVLLGPSSRMFRSEAVNPPNIFNKFCPHLKYRGTQTARHLRSPAGVALDVPTGYWESLKKAEPIPEPTGTETGLLPPPG